MKLSAACTWEKGRYLWKRKLGSVSLPVMLGEAEALQPLLCRQRLWLCCKLQTHRTPFSAAGWRLMTLLQPSSHFLMNVHTVALGFRNEMEGRTHKSQTYEKLRVIKWRRLKDIKLCLFSTTYYEVEEMSKSHCLSKTLMRFKSLENSLSVIAW